MSLSPCSVLSNLLFASGCMLYVVACACGLGFAAGRARLLVLLWSACILSLSGSNHLPPPPSVRPPSLLLPCPAAAAAALGKPRPFPSSFAAAPPRSPRPPPSARPPHLHSWRSPLPSSPPPLRVLLDRRVMSSHYRCRRSCRRRLTCRGHRCADTGSHSSSHRASPHPCRHCPAAVIAAFLAAVAALTLFTSSSPRPPRYRPAGWTSTQAPVAYFPSILPPPSPLLLPLFASTLSS